MRQKCIARMQRTMNGCTDDGDYDDWQLRSPLIDHCWAEQLKQSEYYGKIGLRDLKCVFDSKADGSLHSC